MTEMNDNGNFELTGEMVTVTLNKNNTQVISGLSNYEMGKHGGEFTIEQNQNEKNLFSNINCALFNQENNQDTIPQHLPYEKSQYSCEFGLQQDANMNNAEHTYNSYIKSEVFNKFPVHETNEQQSQYDICEMLNKPEFKILPPKKEKNPPYVIKYDGPFPELTAKRYTEKTKASVRMNIKMAVSYNCRIFLQYDDLASLNNPVKICNTHEKEIESEMNPKPMFIIKGHKEVQYEVYNGHPSYRIEYEGDYIIQFLCRNSCEQNRSNKKNINLQFRFCDNESGICSEDKVILRVAENVKREAGITGPVKVENMKQEAGITVPVKVENMKQEAGITVPVKVRKRSVEEFLENEATQIFINEDDHCTIFQQPPLKKLMLCIQVDSQEDIELYQKLASRLGNEFNIIPVDDIEHQQC